MTSTCKSLTIYYHDLKKYTYFDVLTERPKAHVKYLIIIFNKVNIF